MKSHLSSNRFDSSDSDLRRRMLALIERGGANYTFFFKHASDAAWLPILDEQGFFSHPPNAERVGEGRFAFPNWVPIQYLSKVAKDAPSDVVRILLRLPHVDNPSVYDGILETALQLRGSQSAKLKGKMLEYASLDFQIMAHSFPSLLAHWAAAGETAAALELASALIRFAPDPNAGTKGDRCRKDSEDWANYLKPSPRFESWDYREILTSGVRPSRPERTLQNSLHAHRCYGINDLPKYASRTA